MTVLTMITLVAIQVVRTKISITLQQFTPVLPAYSPSSKAFGKVLCIMSVADSNEQKHNTYAIFEGRTTVIHLETSSL